MIEIEVLRARRGVEELSASGVDETLEVVRQGLGALVVDLDNCLIRDYAGAPTFRRLLSSGVAKPWDLLRYSMVGLRYRISRSSLGFLLPGFLRLSSAEFHRYNLRFELGLDEDSLRRTVTEAMPELLGQVRLPLLEICRAAADAGAKVLLATVNSATFAEALAEALEFHDVLCSRLDRGLGEPAEILVGERKRDAVLSWLGGRGVSVDDAWLVVDQDFSGNDESLMASFGSRLSLIRNPKEGLRKVLRLLLDEPRTQSVRTMGTVLVPPEARI